jgi:hypothetical protein
MAFRPSSLSRARSESQEDGEESVRYSSLTCSDLSDPVKQLDARSYRGGNIAHARSVEESVRFSFSQSDFGYN